MLKKKKAPKELKKKPAFRWGGVSPFFVHPFISNLLPGLKNKTILDCGCGRGIYGYLIRTVRDLSGARLIGIDICQEYLVFCKKHKVYDELIKGNATRLPFKDKSIDLLLCSEVIEHLDERDGKGFLDEVDRVCRGRAIITTPNVWFETVSQEDPDVHRSKWKVSDFKKKGYRVYGIGFIIPPLPGKWYTRIVYALYYFFTPISYFFPELGGSLVAVKDFQRARE